MEKKIFIKNQNEEKLSGVLRKNNKDKNLIIICHGSRGNKNGKLQKFLSKKLKDFNTFRFDFSGNGESEGLMEDATYSKEIEDLLSVINFFENKGFNLISIIGHSKSASEVLIASKELSEKSKSIISISPRINLLESQEMKMLNNKKIEFEEKGYYHYSKDCKINRKYIEDVRKIKNIEKHFESKIPVLIVHGGIDSVIDISGSKDFSIKHKIYFKEIPKADHIYSERKNKKDLSKIIINWLKFLN